MQVVLGERLSNRRRKAPQDVLTWQQLPQPIVISRQPNHMHYRELGWLVQLPLSLLEVPVTRKVAMPLVWVPNVQQENRGSKS